MAKRRQKARSARQDAPEPTIGTLGDLTPDPANRRTHNPRNLAMLTDALRVVGASRSIVVDEAGVILAGNGVVEAASAAGLTKLHIVDADGDTVVAVRRRGLTDVQKRQLAIYDNRTAELAEWNVEQLAADLQNGEDLSAFFLPDELAGLLSAGGVNGGRTDPDIVPPIRATDIRSGDIFELGGHRLLCGDSTVAENVARVMGSDRVRLLVTSPPYTDQRTYKSGPFDWDAMMCGSFDAGANAMTDGGHILINLGLSHKNRQVDAYWNGWLVHCAAVGWPLFGWYVWDKGAGAPGEWNGRLAPAHEFIFHFNRTSTHANKWIPTNGSAAERVRSTAPRFRQKDGSQKAMTSPDKMGQLFKVPDSVIRLNREMARGIHTQHHPAVFPVQFPQFLIETWSQSADLVLDSFLGSGTTLIACEQLNRRGVGIETSAEYVQVTIDRWEAFTGQRAVKVGEAVRA